MTALVQPQRILVIQLRRIGDSLLTTPLLRALRESCPVATIDCLVEASACRVFQGNPILDKVLVYDPKTPSAWIRRIRERRYDWVLDCLSNPRSAILTLASGAPVRAGFLVPFWKIAYNIRVERRQLPEYAAQTKLRLLESICARLGSPFVSKGLSLDFTPTPEEREFAQRWLKNQGFGTSPVIALAATHRRSVRRWTPAGFARLCRLLTQKMPAKVIIAWGPGEEDQLREITSLINESALPLPGTTMGQLAAIFEQCALVIANDNGAKHLAVAMGTPTLTLYGPTHPSNWTPPHDPRHRAFRVEGLGCLGCNLNRCPYQHECMEWMNPEQVFLAARELFLAKTIAKV